MKGVDQINKVYKKNMHEYQTDKLNHAVNDQLTDCRLRDTPTYYSGVTMLSIQYK